MSKGHSSLGASSANRWFECPGSVALVKMSPQQPQNKYAACGTYCHKILEDCFNEDKDPWSYLGDEYFGGTISEDDIQAVEDAIKFLENKVKYVSRKYSGAKVLKEVEFEITVLHPDLWGTSDIVIYTRCLSFLGVYDYKHGTKRVKAEDNVQLMYYMLGAINFLGRNRMPMFDWGDVFGNLELGIIQPRVRGKNKEPEIWNPSAKDLNDFALTLEQKAKATEKSKTYAQGAHCYWCSGKALCPEIYNSKLTEAKNDFK